MIKNKKIIRPVLLLIIIFVLLFVLNKQRSQSPDKYETATISEQPVSDSVKADGKVVAGKNASLNFLLPSKLTYLGVKKGDYVKKYQRLAGVDAKELSTALVAAQYGYTAADANAKEVEDKVQGHEKDESFAQKNMRVTAQTARDTAYENWILARRKIGDASLYAPFDGVVTEVKPTAVGDTVGITDGISMIDPESLYFEAQVDETDFGKIKVGQEVNVSIDAFPDTEFKGKVSYIAPSGIKTQTGGVKVIADIEIDAEGKNLVTELNGTAEIVIDRKPRLVIPNSYIVSKDNKTFTYVVSGNKVKEVEISLGNKYGDLTEISSGLSSGESVAKKKS